MEYTKVNYTCIRCKTNFKNNKTHLEKHFTRKKPCNCIDFYYSYDYLLKLLHKNEYLDFYEKLNNKKQCQYCNKVYIKCNIKRHYKTCKKNPENITKIQIQAEEKESEIILDKNQPQQIINNTTNNIQNNNIHIHINGFNNEDLSKIDFDKLLLLSKDEFNKSTLKDKANNHAHNILSILSDVISEPSNKNYQLVNKKEKKFLIKNTDKTTEYKNLDYINNHLYYLVNDTYKDYVSDIQHYERFLNLIESELDKFKTGNKSMEATQYYSFIKKLKKYIKEKIFWTAEEDKRNNVKAF